jgi:hypothetical protein
VHPRCTYSRRSTTAGSPCSLRVDHAPAGCLAGPRPMTSRSRAGGEGVARQLTCRTRVAVSRLASQHHPLELSTLSTPPHTRRVSTIVIRAVPSLRLRAGAARARREGGTSTTAPGLTGTIRHTARPASAATTPSMSSRRIICKTAASVSRIASQTTHRQQART